MMMKVTDDGGECLAVTNDDGDVSAMTHTWWPMMMVVKSDSEN